MAALVQELEPRLLLSATPATPITITVTTLSDTPVAGQTTLRQAIAAANSGTPGNTITFAAGLTGTITLTQGDLQITNSMNITGPGAALLSVSGNEKSRIFTINDGNATVNQNVIISGLTLTQGDGVGATSSGMGGAVFNDENLTLTNDILSYNTAGSGGGISTGGGSLTLSNDTFSGNAANYGSNVWSLAAPVLPNGAMLASSIVGPNGTVYDLTTSGTLYSWSGSGTAWTPLFGPTPNVLSFNIAPNGTLYALQSNNTLYQYSGSGAAWTAISSANVQSFSISPTGTLYALQSDNTIYQYSGSGTVWAALPGANYLVSSFSVSPNGTLYALETNNTVYQYAGGASWNPISANDVLSLSAAPNGTLYVLAAGNIVYQYAGGASWDLISGNDVLSMSVAPNGSLYVLAEGNLVYQYAGGGTWDSISGNDVLSMSVAPNGSLYALAAGNIVYQYAGAGSWKPISAADVLSTNVAPNGSLYALAFGNVVYEYLSSGTWTGLSTTNAFYAVEYNVLLNQCSSSLPTPITLASFSTAPNGALYALATNNILYEYSGAETPSWTRWTPISGSDVIAFSIAANGAVYVLAGGGPANVIYQYTGVPQEWNLISPAADILSFSIASNGGLYALTATNIVDQYSGSGNAWSVIAPLNTNDSVNPNYSVDDNAVLNAFFSTTIQDPVVASIVQPNFVVNGQLTQAVMQNVLTAVANQRGTITSAAINSLNELVYAAGFLDMPLTVEYLTNQVVGGNPANVYSGGQLAVGSPSTLLTALVEQWFDETSGTSYTQSDNWSGYAAEASPQQPVGSVTSVSGEWTVPAISSSGASTTQDSVIWVGIDGFNNNTVEQIGTGQVIAGPGQSPSYYAWWEMYSAQGAGEPGAGEGYEIPNMTIGPGDKIGASVTYLGSGEYFLAITDLSRNETKGYTESTATWQSPQATGSTAEWIVESPANATTKSIYSLPNFGTVLFTNCSATINGVYGPINATNVVSYQLDHTTSTGTVDAFTSDIFGGPLGGITSAFSVQYGPRPEYAPDAAAPANATVAAAPTNATVAAANGSALGAGVIASTETDDGLGQPNEWQAFFGTSDELGGSRVGGNQCAQALDFYDSASWLDRDNTLVHSHRDNDDKKNGQCDEGFADYDEALGLGRMLQPA